MIFLHLLNLSFLIFIILLIIFNYFISLLNISLLLILIFSVLSIFFLDFQFFFLNFQFNFNKLIVFILINQFSFHNFQLKNKKKHFINRNYLLKKFCNLFFLLGIFNLISLHIFFLLRNYF